MNERICDLFVLHLKKKGFTRGNNSFRGLEFMFIMASKVANK